MKGKVGLITMAAVILMAGLKASTAHAQENDFDFYWFSSIDSEVEEDVGQDFAQISIALKPDGLVTYHVWVRAHGVTLDHESPIGAGTFGYQLRYTKTPTSLCFNPPPAAERNQITDSWNERLYGCHSLDGDTLTLTLWYAEYGMVWEGKECEFCRDGGDTITLTLSP